MLEENNKSNAQTKREYEQDIKIKERHREQDIRLRCLEMVMYHGPDEYKRGDKIYRIANRMYSYIMNHANPDIEYQNFI